MAILDDASVGMKVDYMIRQNQSNFLATYPQVTEPSYIIYKSGSTIYAKDGNNGTITRGTDATTIIQNTINATPSGGKITIKKGNYQINQPIDINKSIYFCGETMGTKLQPLPALPDAALNQFDGVVFTQITPATNILNISGAGIQPQIENLVLVFDDSIRGTNTGHGIYAVPPVRNTYLDNGIDKGVIRNIVVVGADGNHYGFYIANPLSSILENIISLEGGGITLICNSQEVHYGNCVITGFYNYLKNSGTSHGIYLVSVSTFDLNLVTFIRPQVNVHINPGQVTQKHFTYTNGAGGFVRYISLRDIDFEANNQGGVDLPTYTIWEAQIASGIPGWSTPDYYLLNHDFYAFRTTGSYVGVANTFYMTSGTYRGTPSVTETETTYVITHNIGNTSHITTVTPNWNTSLWITKGNLTDTVNFGTAAPAGAIIDFIIIRFDTP